MTSLFVLDAWAILAFLQKEEPAASRVAQLFQSAQEDTAVQLFITVINLGEVYYIVGGARGEAEAQRALSLVQKLPLSVLSATNERVFAAAGFKMKRRLSYADAFAATAARELAATLLTGDPELIQLQGEVAEVAIEALFRTRPQ